MPDTHRILFKRTRLVAVLLAHGVVDFFSALVIPIISVLEGRVEMSPAQGALLIAMGSIASGIIQPVVALISDRFDTRWAGWVGSLIAVAAIGLIGYARTYEQLMFLQALGCAGIGAFHPIGAAAAGHLAGERRAQGLSAFFFVGVSGTVVGSWTCPLFVKAFGVEALLWFTPASLVFIVALLWASHAIPHRHANAHAEHAALPKHERDSRWREITLLYVANVLRYLVNMSLVLAIARWCEERVLARAGAEALDATLRADASALNGPRQAAMALGMGCGGLLAGSLLRGHHEKGALLSIPLVGAGACLAFPRVAHEWNDLAGLLLAVLCGVGYFAVIPITVARAQRLLPHRTSLASSLMMGGSWCVACIGPPGAQWLLKHGWSLGDLFTLLAGLLVLSAVLALGLPGQPMGKSSA